MAIPQRDNTNLAYDLSRFDTSQRERREQERAKEEAAKRQIRIAPHSVSRSGSVALVMLVTAVVFGAFCAVNTSATMKDDMARQVSEQQALLESAQDDNELLQSKLDSKVNISYIEQYATEDLGMQKVTSAQKKYISVNTESLIEIDDDGSDGFLAGVKEWFGDLLEYIGL